MEVVIGTFKDSPFSPFESLVKKVKSLTLAAGIKTFLLSYNKTEARRNRLIQEFESFHEICIY